jgi:anti-sigma regulatory factor (Ser/Thr protein kinase)
MYQAEQVASTQVRDRRYEDRQPEAPKSMLSATTDRQVRITLPPVPESAGMARDFTAAALRKWHLDSLISDAVLIASELVTNAISHGTKSAAPQPPGSVELTWSYQVSRLICVITDRAAQPPAMVPVDADADAESGHGLQIVAALAAAWGWTMLGTGEKAVWAALDLP